MKWVVQLRSKYTGEEIWLGSQYSTYDDANKFAEKEVCSRCNGWAIVQIPDGMMWVNKNVGFKAKQDILEARKQYKGFDNLSHMLYYKKLSEESKERQIRSSIKSKK